MHIRLTPLVGRRLRSRDGHILARLCDIQINPVDWTIQHLVADLGTWYPERLIGISSHHVRWHHLDDETSAVPTDLARHDIYRAPRIDPSDHWARVQRLVGARVVAHTQDMGSCAELYLQPDRAKIDYFAVLDDRERLLATRWISSVEPRMAQIRVDVPPDLVKRGPGVATEQAVHPQLLRDIHRHYGRPIPRYLVCA